MTHVVEVVENIVPLIAAERLRRGMTKRRLAEELGVDWSTMWKWANGYSYGPSFLVLLRMLRWLESSQSLPPAHTAGVSHPDDGQVTHGSHTSCYGDPLDVATLRPDGVEQAG